MTELTDVNDRVHQIAALIGDILADDGLSVTLKQFQMGMILAAVMQGAERVGIKIELGGVTSKEGGE